MNLTDEQLRRLMREYEQQLYASLPPPWEGEFSPEFERNMAALIRKTERRYILRRVLRTAAAAVLVLVMLGAVTLLAAPTARAAFVGWAREFFPKGVSYSVEDTDAEPVLPEFEISGIPEDMKADFEEKDNNSYIAMYYDVSEEHWVYIQLTIGGSTVVSYEGEDTPLEVKAVNINGNIAQYIYDPEEESHDFFWVDERTKVVVAIGSNLDYSVTLHICESLKLYNSTK